MGNGKPTKCPICREKLSSGKALGGHMSRHRATRQRLAAASGKTSPAKASKCKICGELMGSGRAIGGHMSKHSRDWPPGLPSKLSRAAGKRLLVAAKSIQGAGFQGAKGTQGTSTSEHRTAYSVETRKGTDVTLSFGPVMNQALKLVDSLHAAAKRKRDEATKLEASSMALVKTKRDEANELDRLAERVGHIL